MTVLVVVEHDRGTMAPATLEAIAAARTLGEDVHAITIGQAADGLVEQLGAHGVSLVVQAHHPILTDYGPEAWGETVAQLVQQYSPTAWPYIGPFYPYPQVPLGWRKVTLEWDDGWWFLDFKDCKDCH